MASPSPKRIIPQAMFPPTATPRLERSHAVEFLRERSRVAALWDVQKEHPPPRARCPGALGL